MITKNVIQKKEGRPRLFPFPFFYKKKKVFFTALEDLLPLSVVI